MNIEVTIPDNASGNWKVETFTVSKEEAAFWNMRAVFSFSHKNRPIEAGTYKRLIRNRTCVMSNTPSEIDDHAYFIYKCKQLGGHILINGLGLGVCLKKILEFDNVETVTVIEKSKDVISLVGTHFSNDRRVTIIQADALEWKLKKGTKYSVVWHDIWDNICEDNIQDMKKLHRKYGHRCTYQASWCRSEAESKR